MGKKKKEKKEKDQSCAEVSTAPAPSSEELDELEEKRYKYKMRVLGNIGLVGQLLVRKMVASKVLVACCEELLAEPSSATLEPLANLLTATGPEFDCADWSHHKQLRAIFEHVKTLVKDKELPCRTRFILQDVLDLRASGWVDKKLVTKKNEGPMKMDEIASK